MQQLYQIFYRENGVRRLSELASPRLQTFKGFPRNSVFHLLTEDDEMFPDSSKPYFQNYSQRLPMDLVFRSDVMVGNPHVVTFNPQTFTGPFVQKNRLFRYIPNAAEMPSDERTLVVVDYNPLKHSYRYIKTPMADLLKWQSYQRTMWNKIGQLATKTKKHHFVLIDSVTDIPSLGMLNNFGTKEGMTLSRVFNTPDKLFILNLFNWLRDDTTEQHSVFKLIPKESLNRINLIFLLKDGRCSVLNLALLYSWVKGHDNVSGIKLSSQYDDGVVRRTLIKYFLVLASSIPEDASEPPLEAERSDEPEAEDLETMDDDIPLSGIRPTVSDSTEAKEYLNSNPKSIVNSEDELPTSLMSSLDEDLEILEKKNLFDLNQRGLSVKGKELTIVSIDPKSYSYDDIIKEIQTSLTPNEALKKKLNKALEIGTLTAATYRKAMTEAQAYEKMMDPYGTKRPLSQRIKIDPKALDFNPESIQLRDNPTVLDKSMVKSSLQAFTYDYVSQHLGNDVLKMVGALQKGGVIIQNHEITKEHTVMGNAEIHRLEIKPINGVGSTIYFRLPVIEEDGTYKVAGNKYFLRKQRVDSNFC